MWIDISKRVHNNVELWPGDTPFHFKLDYELTEENPVNVGQIQMSTHIGTHIDAPYHYDNDGMMVDEIDINRLIGKAQVIEMIDEELITKAHLEKISIECKIVLFKTRYNEGTDVFEEEFTALSKDAVTYLAEQGVTIIGIDTPSIDPLKDESLTAHLECLKHKILIIELLELYKVRNGVYDFIGLPIKMQTDAAPLRAVVRKEAR